MLKNYWHVGCASSQLKDQPYSAQIFDQKLVLFRDSNGKVYALIDRCCHRGFPLSRGKINDGNLICGYHGWEYDGSGQCVKIPSQNPEKSIPKSHCVQSFLCVEKDEFVWVWMGDDAPVEVPFVLEVSFGRWLQGSRVINCNFMRALEITYDSVHFYFMHPTRPATIAAKKFGFAEGSGEIRLTKNGCLMFMPATKSENDPIPPYAVKMEFELPGRIRFEFSVGNSKGYIYFWTTPLTETTCRMDWLLSNPSSEGTERIYWTGEGQEIIGEDQYVLDLVQKTYEKEGETFERSVEADTPVLTMRCIVRAAEKGEWNSENFPMPKRRIFNSVGLSSFFKFGHLT